jgi:hypothetical protein
MFLKGGALAISVMTMIALPAVIAQNGGAAAATLRQDDAGIVLGQPLAAIEKTVAVKPLADGTTITTRTEERKWRDAQGRFRKEVTEVSVLVKFD